MKKSHKIFNIFTIRKRDNEDNLNGNQQSSSSSNNNSNNNHNTDSTTTSPNAGQTGKS